MTGRFIFSCIDSDIFVLSFIKEILVFHNSGDVLNKPVYTWIFDSNINVDKLKFELFDKAFLCWIWDLFFYFVDDHDEKFSFLFFF